MVYRIRQSSDRLRVDDQMCNMCELILRYGFCSGLVLSICKLIMFVLCRGTSTCGNECQRPRMNGRMSAFVRRPTKDTVF